MSPFTTTRSVHLNASKMRLSSYLRALAAALAAFATPLLGTAQAGFHQVAPTGSYLTASPFDAPANPLIVSLAGLGNTINLMPSGILREHTLWSPDHQAKFCGVFTSTTELLSPYTSNRVVTPIAATGAPACVSQATFYFGIQTDFPEDFLIPEIGVTVGVPMGANFLMIAAEDSQYEDNATPDQSVYGVTVSSVVPEPSTHALMAFGLAGIVFATRKRNRHNAH